MIVPVRQAASLLSQRIADLREASRLKIFTAMPRMACGESEPEGSVRCMEVCMLFPSNDAGSEPARLSKLAFLADICGTILALAFVRDASRPVSSKSAPTLALVQDRTASRMVSRDRTVLHELSDAQLDDAGIDRFAIRPRKPSIEIEAGLMTRLMLMR
jgi:uncharacterized protein YjiS (DUF1127 family)